MSRDRKEKENGKRKPVKSDPWKMAEERASRSGRVKSKVSDKRKYPSTSDKTWIGIVSAHPDGFGFVDSKERDKGLFLPKEEMQNLMHGDKVEVRISHHRGRESASLVRIIEEVTPILTGQYNVYGSTGTVSARSRKFPQPISIAKRDSQGAQDGDWVRLEVKRGSSPLCGRVLTLLGDMMKPSALVDAVIAEQGMTIEFPDEVLEQSTSIPVEIQDGDKDNRLSLVHLPFVTIDGEDARDFDDAICVRPRGEGFEAWVAIADVAAYVEAGSAMDIEAGARANSFYFPDRVIPMLPEKLSNGLCSLNPNVDRLAMVVRMRYDANGRCRSSRAYEAVIHSQARLTYTQAASWLEDGDATAIASSDIRSMLNDAKRLYEMLDRNRKRRGALDLDVGESSAVLVDDTVSEIVVRGRNVAHCLIEEMMLAANTSVATFMETRKCGLLYRVHAPPERKAIESLNEFLAPFALFVHLPKPTRKGGDVKPGDVQQVLQRAIGKPFAHVLQRLVLRSMQQAKYTPENLGHFGLAYDSYCHFTSPIRRYADLTVHRRLKALLRSEDPDTVQPMQMLASIGEHTSIQERKQQRAEWDTQAMLAALYHSKDVGKSVAAKISGLTKRRVFFELESTLAEASMDVESLGKSLELDEKQHRLVAKRSGESFNLGDQLHIMIDSTDPVRGMIHVHIVDG
ncbi:MAG: ribonuclease R [Mariprofundaceae bacterium]